MLQEMQIISYFVSIMLSTMLSLLLFDFFVSNLFVFRVFGSVDEFKTYCT